MTQNSQRPTPQLPTWELASWELGIAWLGPRVVGERRLVAQDRAAIECDAPTDVTVPAEDGVADHRLLADTAVRPDDCAVDRCALVDLRLPADHRVRTNPG